MKLREKAESIFAWGLQARGVDETSELWKTHSFAAARIAETIAEKCGLDPEKAYADGLLHDIGKYQGITKQLVRHVVAGYEKLMKEEMPEQARICMTHSFCPKEKIAEFREDEPAEMVEKVKGSILEIEYDDYDKLIQLADYMAGGHGITTVERRFCSVLARHGLTDPQGDLLALLNLKEYFDKKCGINIYELFADEIRERAIIGVFDKEEDKK